MTDERKPVSSNIDPSHFQQVDIDAARKLLLDAAAGYGNEPGTADVLRGCARLLDGEPQTMEDWNPRDVRRTVLFLEKSVEHLEENAHGTAVVLAELARVLAEQEMMRQAGEKPAN